MYIEQIYIVSKQVSTVWAVNDVESENPLNGYHPVKPKDWLRRCERAHTSAICCHTCACACEMHSEMCERSACVRIFFRGAKCDRTFAHFLQQNGQNLLFFNFFPHFLTHKNVLKQERMLWNRIGCAGAKCDHQRIGVRTLVRAP